MAPRRRLIIFPERVFGVLAELRLPMTLLGDLLMVLFIRKLWKKYTPREKALSPLMV
jgi:hypothetical protein